MKHEDRVGQLNERASMLINDNHYTFRDFKATLNKNFECIEVQKKTYKVKLDLFTKIFKNGE